MTDKQDTGPLSSEELERDRERSGQDEALGDRLGTDEGDGAVDRDGDEGRGGLNPIAGTMLPPD